MTGRVIEEHKTNYVVLVDDTEYTAVVRGHFHIDDSDAPYPKVGDFVECEKTADDQLVIEKILPRKTEIARKTERGSARQVMVANADLMLIVMGLDDDFNLRRLERYLVLAKQSVVTPVIILSKADLVEDPESFRIQVSEMAPQVAIHSVSAKTGVGMEAFKEHIGPETVAVLLGSSGAGKSTITNWLLQEDRQETGEVRADDSRGRHTTTRRQMFKLPQGGYLVDTPGMRELGVLEDEIDPTDVFADIAALMEKCKYADCDHDKSDGCAIKAALASGELSTDRYQSYLKLEREREFQRSKGNEETAYERKQRVRKLHTGYNKIIKHKHSNRDRLDE